MDLQGTRIRGSAVDIVTRLLAGRSMVKEFFACPEVPDFGAQLAPYSLGTGSYSPEGKAAGT